MEETRLSELTADAKIGLGREADRRGLSREEKDRILDSVAPVLRAALGPKDLAVVGREDFDRTRNLREALRALVATA